MTDDPYKPPRDFVEEQFRKKSVVAQLPRNCLVFGVSAGIVIWLLHTRGPGELTLAFSLFAVVAGAGVIAGYIQLIRK